VEIASIVVDLPVTALAPTDDQPRRGRAARQRRRLPRELTGTTEPGLHRRLRQARGEALELLVRLRWCCDPILLDHLQDDEWVRDFSLQSPRHHLVGRLLGDGRSVPAGRATRWLLAELEPALSAATPRAVDAILWAWSTALWTDHGFVHSLAPDTLGHLARQTETCLHQIRRAWSARPVSVEI